MKARRHCGRFAIRPRVSLPVRAGMAAICWLLAHAGFADLPVVPPTAPPAAGVVAEQAADMHAATTPDLWVVSTRHLPDVGRVPSSAPVAVERFAVDGACGRWEPADLAGLLDEPSRPLVIFIHGNRYDAADAKSQGLLLARRCAATLPEAAAARTVIFSWPSSQQGILLRDSRAKYERAETEGRYLAWLLGQVEPARPVAVVAYSYGALITLEALDNLVRATQAGRPDVTPWIDRPGRVHLVLAASAVRQDALAPCGAYRRVTQCIDRLTLLNNSRDSALKFFEFIDPSLRTKALGREHMPARWLPADVEFVQVDAADIVGRDHRFPPYMSSPSLRKRIATGLLGGLEGE
jgi:hypothetical protein